MRVLFSIVVLLLFASISFGQVYSQKLIQIPTNYGSNWQGAKEYVLSSKDGAVPSNVSTVFKVGHTEDEVIFGFKCFDHNTTLLDRNTYSMDTSYYNKDRIEIYIALKSNPNNYQHYVVSPKGIVYDAIGMDISYNNRYKVMPYIGENDWNFVLTIDKKLLSNVAMSSVNDTWLIKIIRKSGRNNIPVQSLSFNGKDLYDWQKLYFSDDETAFKSFSLKTTTKVKELNRNKTVLPKDLEIRLDNYIKEINSLLVKDAKRDSVTKIENLLDKCNAEIRYYVGATSQAKTWKLSSPLPFMVSFADSNTRFYSNKENRYINNTNLNFTMAKGERKSFQVVLSSYSDIPNINISLLGDLNKYVNVGYVGDVSLNNELVQDTIIMSDKKASVDFSGVQIGQSKTVWVTVDIPNNLNPGIYRSVVKLTTPDNSISLPLTVNVLDFNLDKNLDFVIPNTDLGLNFGLYTGYVKSEDNNYELSDMSLYLNSITDVCSFLIDHRINSVRFNVVNYSPWFVYSENEFGKWTCKSNVFEVALKTIFLSGIKTVYLDSFKDIDDSNKGVAFARELVDVINRNGWKNKVYITIDDDDMSSKKWSEYIDIIKTAGIKTLFVSNSENNTNIKYADIIVKDNSMQKIKDSDKESAINFNAFSLDRNLLDTKCVAWNGYLNGDKKMVVPFNLWDMSIKNNPFNIQVSENGYNGDFIVYPIPDMDKYKFGVINSMRMEAVTDAIVDMQYLIALNNTIDTLKKNYKGNEAHEGEVLIMQFKDLVLSKTAAPIYPSDFDSIRQKIGDFINRNK